MGGLRPRSLRAARPSLGAPACLPLLATSPPDGSISCRPPGRGRPAFAEVPYPLRASARVVGCPTVQRAPASARVRDLPPRWEVQLTHAFALLTKSLWPSSENPKHNTI